MPYKQLCHTSNKVIVNDQVTTILSDMTSDYTDAFLNERMN